jgi:very-short-patch-repair endonuclease
LWSRLPKIMDMEGATVGNSKGEETLAILLRHYKIPFHREFRFHPTRKWRFDFVIGDFPSMMKIAVEVEGGVYSNGRHTRGSGYSADLVKYNTAILCGWKVLRYTTKQINTEVIEQIKYLVEMQSEKSTFIINPTKSGDAN